MHASNQHEVLLNTAETGISTGPQQRALRSFWHRWQTQAYGSRWVFDGSMAPKVGNSGRVVL